MGADRRVAAFDLDGTLTTRDTLVPFLRRVAGNGAVLRAVFLTSPQLIAAALQDRRRNAAKAAFFRRLLRGRQDAELRELGARYADHVVATWMRADSVTRLEEHQASGHEVVIVSASPELYVEAIGERLGVDAVLATRLEVEADGRLTGEIVDSNVRREEKVRRLDDWLRGPAEVWAYGDSTGDTELLARADHPTRV